MLDSNTEYPISGYFLFLEYLMFIGQFRRFYKQILMTAFLAVIICFYLYTRESTFQECVLNHIKDSSNDSASLVYQMCEEKYAQKAAKHNTFVLDPSQLAMITGRAGPMSVGSPHFLGSLYNGNESITLAEVVILVTSKQKKDDLSTSREYRVGVNVPPKSADDFSFTILVGNSGAEYSWNIVSAKGFKN